MQKNKILAITAMLSLVATSTVLAQEGTMPPPPRGEGKPPQGGMVKQLFNNFREERKEVREEFKEDYRDAKKEFKEDMKERREGMMGSSTSSTTPWKNLKENMKEARKEFKEGMKDIRDNMKEMLGRPAPLNATATAAIAAKLGMTPEALQAQLASGTKLKDLIKDKISSDEMKKILPPRVATFTKAIEEKGFFNNFRARLFGQRMESVREEMNEFGEIKVSTSTEGLPGRPFWQRFFNL